MLEKIRETSDALKREAMAVCCAYRDPRLGLWPKIILALVAAYLASPIDLIPDFIPVLGLVDDLVILAGAVWLVKKMIPAFVIEDARKNARLASNKNRILLLAGACIVIILYSAAGLLLYRIFR